MPTDYAKKKVVELEELLKSRSLPHNGKKADLISRLHQNDAEQESKPPQQKADAEVTDEITDDLGLEDGITGPPASAALAAAGGKGQPPNPTAVPNQEVATDPAATDDLTVDPPAPTTEDGKAEPAKPPPDFTEGIKETALDEEVEKRKKRAERFGITQNEDEEKKKALERAKKFGIKTKVIEGLDKALPEPGPRKRGRGAENGDKGQGRRDGGKRSRVKVDEGERGWRRGSRGETAEGRGKGGKTLGMTDKDREAAEKRKQRFAA